MLIDSATQPLFFLQEDLEHLHRKQASLSADIEAAGQEMGEANRQSSETWHDNAPLDVAQRKFERLGEQHQQLAQILRRAVILPENFAPDSVGPTSSVVFEVAYRRRRFTLEQKLKTTTSAERRTLHFVDSLLPESQHEGHLVQHLVGRRVGDSIPVKIAADTAKTVLGIDVQTKDESKPTEAASDGRFEFLINQVTPPGPVGIGSLVAYTATFERVHQTGFKQRVEVIRKRHSLSIQPELLVATVPPDPNAELAKVLVGREANEPFSATVSARAAMSAYAINIQPTYQPPPRRQSDEMNLRVLDVIPSAGATIGSQVTYSVNGVEAATIRVGSFRVASEGRISYATPLARLLLGLQEGDVQNGLLGGKEVEVEVLCVEN
ncbi:MAG: hypothetical protein F4Y86_00250 [Gammaproteobacteria bacterium]|nr:hypothetical protein [Gammaproteobacteria bacterium]